MEESRNVYKMSAIKQEGKRLVWKSMRRWEDNMRIELKEIGLHRVDWIHLTQDMDR
jgi:hypothetical protein